MIRHARIQLLPLWLAIWASIAITTSVHAADALPVAHEIEPNDDPVLGAAVSAPVMLSGSLPEANDQDAYRWLVSDADAAKMWNITLEGMPDALTGVSLIDVTLDDAGTAVTARENLLTFGIRDGSRAVTKRNVLLPPGETVVGVFGAGQSGPGFRPPGAAALAFANDDDEVASDDPPETTTAYRVSIEGGDSIGLFKTQPHATQAQALTLREKSLAGDITTSAAWYRFTVPDSAQLSRVTIDAGIELGRTLHVRLLSADGEEISTGHSDQVGQVILPNLALPAGDYFVETEDRSKMAETPCVRWVRWRRVGEVAEGEEREPNSDWATANAADLISPLSGLVDQPRDVDVFAFSLNPEQESHSYQLRLTSESLTKVTLCLLTEAGQGRQCRSGAPPVTLDGLSLTAGQHGAKVERASGEGAYQLQLIASDPLSARIEQEPNDRAEDATVFGKRPILKGALTSQDIDHFTLLTTDEPQLWRIQANGKGLLDLRYYPQHGSKGLSVRAGANSSRLRLDNVFLLPGRHHFTLSGREDTSYVVRALPLGPPDPNVEREPNDDRTQAHRLPMNGTATALLTETSDVDFYRFYLTARQGVRLSLDPTPGAQYRTTLYQDGGQIKQFFPAEGAGFSEVLWLDPGDYYLRVSAYKASEGEYEVHLEQHGVLPDKSDQEPNDTPNMASPWPANGLFEGDLGTSRAGSDWYQLPERHEPIELALVGETDVRVGFITADRSPLGTLESLSDGRRVVTLDAAERGYLQVSGTGAYRFKLSSHDDSLLGGAQASPVTLNLTAEHTTVAAYADWQQSIQATLSVQNLSDDALTLDLQAATTDDRWQVTLAQPTVTLAPNAEERVALTTHIAPDVWPDEAVRIVVSARAGSSQSVTTSIDLLASRNGSLRAPQVPQPAPPELSGHVNVALASRGAEWQDQADKYATLNDGVLAIGHYFNSGRDGIDGPAEDTPVIKLASEAPVPITGFVLHPFGLQGSMSQRNADRYAVDLSIDGVAFDTAASGRLHAHTREQFIPLEAPIPARYARLRLLSSKERQAIALGEWKVLASSQAHTETNLADPIHGGHVVSVLPPLPNYGYVQPILVEGDDSASIRMRTGFDAAWVLGFHQNRAARIDRIRWHNTLEAEASNQRFATARILVSTTSPLGPWTDLGEWDVGGDKQTFELETPVWARFVRFDVADTAPRTWMHLPDLIEVIEAPDAFGSILGEWGHSASSGPFELAHPKTLPEDSDVRPPHIDRARAQRLPIDTPMPGKVRLSHYDNWYRVQVPEGHNSLTVTLRAEGQVRAQAALSDASQIAMETVVMGEQPDARVYQARVSPGEYWIQVSEPPRSVIFTWDTSGSTAAVRPIIRQAVLSYVKDVKPGLDEARMLPFGGEFLSRQWIDQPYLLQSTLNDYNGAGNSSAAESALVKAATALNEQPGQRVIVLITDAATSTDPALWPTLESSRPRIIALGVSSAGAFASNPDRERDLLQDWAMVGDGYYEYIESVGALERAFDRASSKIREPATYQIEAQTAFLPEPKPGFLEVAYVDAEAEDTALSLPPRTVEIVLDASGSMLQRMHGQRRYQIARATLSNLVQETLPSDIHFALRVFGHQEPGACRTDLVLPPATLDRDSAIATLNQIQPMNLAKTPIAASLQAAASDLSTATGEKTVLLITDGEETCDGDVEAAIDALTAAGVEATVNIVGFALDDAELESTFENWARLGGGTYRTATDESELTQTLAAFSNPVIIVRSDKGAEVAKGRVGGEPLELAPGNYTLSIGSSVQKNVRIESAAITTVTVSH